MRFDFATISGLLFGITIVTLAIASGSDFSIFINLPGFAIVVGGTFAATMVKFPISGVFVSMPIGLKAAFSNDNQRSADLINTAIRLVKLARKNGLVTLEKQKVSNPFFTKGLQLCADGKDADFIRKVLTEEMSQEIRREEIGSQVFKAIGQTLDAAPNGLEFERGKIAVAGAGRTSVKGVWAGGDCTNEGDDLTVTAVAQGRDAAEDIHKTLLA